MSAALAYLASLSPKGRQTMVERLRVVAALLAAEGSSPVPWDALPWHELRFAHVASIRQRLLEESSKKSGVSHESRRYMAWAG